MSIQGKCIQDRQHNPKKKSIIRDVTTLICTIYFTSDARQIFHKYLIKLTWQGLVVLGLALVEKNIYSITIRPYRISLMECFCDMSHYFLF